MTVLEVLKATRKRLEKPEAWCKGTSGPPHGPNCLFGGMLQCSPYQVHVRDLAVDVVEKCIGGDSLVGFNDRHSTTHADILALLDRAIEEESK